MNNELMFSSATDKWDTPQSLIDDLATVFDWDLDVCASRANVCDWYHDIYDDGLLQEWHGLCWMNPPYGRAMQNWMSKARGESTERRETSVVCLVPARTDTRWWHDNVIHASQVVLIKGRLKFGGAKNSAPFPSAFVVFGKLTQEQHAKLASYGMSMSIFGGDDA